MFPNKLLYFGGNLIGLQSYLQYAINEEIEHFGISLQTSIYSDPFNLLRVERPDSGYSRISIEYVSY